MDAKNRPIPKPRSHRSIDEPESGLQLTDGEEEVSSLCSDPCYGNVSGDIKLGVWYRDDEQVLYVQVVKVSGLVPVQKKSLNPYVKAYLLPNKNNSTKRKTAIQHKTTNAVYVFNEIFKVSY